MFSFFNLSLINSLIIILICCSVISFAFFLDNYIKLIYLKKYAHRFLLNLDIPKKFNYLNEFFYQLYLIIKLDDSHIYQKKKRLKEIIYIQANIFQSRIEIIGVISTISPLIGILGTILGIIKGIQSLNNESLKLLNTGLWESLITTALGLFIAIISNIFYSYLIFKLNIYLEKIHQAMLKILDKTQ